MKSLRAFGVLAGSFVVMISAVRIVARAAVTITTPNSATVSYTLAPGATSGAITPVTNQPVLLMGANMTATDFSVSSVTLIHVPSTMIRWIGLEANPSATVIHGGSAAPGTHVVYLDYNHKVDVEVFSADEFVIHNGSTGSESGSIKLIW